jgi:hypothetical protein
MSNTSREASPSSSGLTGAVGSRLAIGSIMMIDCFVDVR